MDKKSNNIIGIYDNQDKLLGSIKTIQDKGVRVRDVITPYPIHEVFDLLKLKTRLPVAAFFYGIIAIGITFAFLYWTSVVNYPLKFGGKPQNTLSFIIVIFVMTINITALFTIISFFLREKKGPGAKYDAVDLRLTDDKFAVLIDREDEMTDKEVNDINDLLKNTGAIEVMQKEVKFA